MAGRGRGTDLVTPQNPYPSEGYEGFLGGPTKINKYVIHYIYNNLYYLFENSM